MDCITGVSVTVAVRIRETRLILSLYTIRASAAAAAAAAAAAGCCWLLLHECLQSTRNQSRTNSRGRACVRINVRMYVRARARARGERENGREMKVDEDITPTAPRGQKGCFNLSNEGSLHLSSGHGDGRADKVLASPSPRPFPGKVPFTCLFARLRRFATSTSSGLRIPG